MEGFCEPKSRFGNIFYGLKTLCRFNHSVSMRLLPTPSMTCAGLVETIADERHRLAESLANAPGLRWTTEPGQKPPKPMGEPR